MADWEGGGHGPTCLSSFAVSLVVESLFPGAKMLARPDIVSRFWATGAEHPRSGEKIYTAPLAFINSALVSNFFFQARLGC